MSAPSTITAGITAGSKTTVTAEAAAPSRRDRLRAQTMTEITAAARQRLVADGPGGIQLRAVARDVGLTAPALYRYYPSLEDLVAALTVDLYDELIEAMVRARDVDPDADAFARMLGTSRAFRRWAVTHPHEFGLLFANPAAAFAHAPDSPCQEASSRFGNVFAELFLEIWAGYPFDVEEPETLPAGMVEGLTPYWSWLTSEVAPTIPMGAVVVFLECWVRMYGTVAMEVSGHLSWAMPDGAPMFEQSLRSMARAVGQPARYAPPVTAPAR